MNNTNLLVDENHHQRVKTGEFLFITSPKVDNEDEVYRVEMGNQIKKFKHIFDNKTSMEIYKIFKKYIKGKNMEVQVLKDSHDTSKSVDKLYTEENNLIEICSIENKFPCMDTYYTQNIDALKADIKKYLKSNK